MKFNFKYLFVSIVSIALAGCSLSGPAAVTPTQDPMIAALATTQAQQAAAMSTLVANMDQPAVIQQIPAPTQGSAIVEQPAAQQSGGVSSLCITEAEFEALVGVRADIDRTEPCAFHWRGDPATISVAHPCPDGWICTLGSNDKNYVYSGVDSLPSLEIFSGTWRKVITYPAGDAVYNHCDFLAKVQHEGAISNPTWTAEAGNFNDCY